MSKYPWMGKYNRPPLPEVDGQLFEGIKGIDEIIDKLPHYYIKAYSHITDMAVWRECTWDGNHFRTIHDCGWLYKPEQCGYYISVDDPDLDLDVLIAENKERMVHLAHLTSEWLESMGKENNLLENKKEQAIEEIEELD